MKKDATVQRRARRFKPEGESRDEAGLPVTRFGRSPGFSSLLRSELRSRTLAGLHPEGFGIDQKRRGCERDPIRHAAVQVVQALDHKSVAQRVVETIVRVHNAKGAALHFRENEVMYLAYATPNWVWAEGEVSILLSEGDLIHGRLLLGQRNDRDDYTLEEIEDIRAATLPIVRNMHKLVKIQPIEEASDH